MHADQNPGSSERYTNTGIFKKNKFYWVFRKSWILE